MVSEHVQGMMTRLYTSKKRAQKSAKEWNKNKLKRSSKVLLKQAEIRPKSTSKRASEAGKSGKQRLAKNRPETGLQIS